MNDKSVTKRRSPSSYQYDGPAAILEGLLAWLSQHLALAASIGLFFGFLIVRLPFRAQFPVNWDAVQFAMATESFNLHAHRPHPPGYIGYVYFGKLLNIFTGDPNTSLVIISIVGGSLAPALFFVLARNFMAQGYALLTAIVFGTSPVLWYYSEVALTYAVEGAIVLLFLWVAYRALASEASWQYVVATSLVLSLVGAFRQSAMLFLIPLWLYVLWLSPWRLRIQAVVLTGMVTLIWAVPLLWLSGGPTNYLQESRALADLVGTSILPPDPAGLLKNFGFLLAGLVLGINAGIGVIIAAQRKGIRVISSLSRRDRYFLLLWAGPALLTYLLGHTGQLGYVIILLPIGFLWVGMILQRVGEVLSGSRRPVGGFRKPSLNGYQVVLPIIALLVAINSVGFIFLPRAANAMMEEPAPFDVRQFDIQASDAYWHELTTLIQTYDPTTTAIFTTVGGPRVSATYRHLSYLLPDYYVYGLGKAVNGAYGQLFLAHEGDDNYSVEGLESAEDVFHPQPEIRHLVIPDPEIVNHLDSDISYYTSTINNSTEVTIAEVPPNTTITFNLGGELIQFVCENTEDLVCPTPQTGPR